MEIRQDRPSTAAEIVREIAPAKHFTTAERLLLLNLLLEHVEILSNKDSTFFHAKRVVWQQISNLYHRREGIEPRTIRQLQKFWENYKARRKKAVETGRSLQELLLEDIRDLQHSVANEDAILDHFVKQERNIDSAEPSLNTREHSQMDDISAHEQEAQDDGESPEPEPEPEVFVRDDSLDISYIPRLKPGPPGLLRFGGVEITPIIVPKRPKVEDFNHNSLPPKKPRLEAAETYYELKIQNEIERHELEKQILKQKLDNLRRKQEKELQVMNVEIACKEEYHNSKMVVLRKKLDSVISI